MKVIKFNGIKPELIELDYNVLQEEMKRCEEKGKIYNVETYTKLLERISITSKSEEIESEVDKIIDEDKDKITSLKEEIKKLEKEIDLLSNFSSRKKRCGCISCNHCKFRKYN